jgi:hypothetical protein
VAVLLRGLAGVVEDGCVIGDRWGVSEHEVARSYPCDAFVCSPRLQAWRGVCVTARVKQQANATLVQDAVIPYPRQLRTFTSSATMYKYTARLIVHWVITGLLRAASDTKEILR